VVGSDTPRISATDAGVLASSTVGALALYLAEGGKDAAKTVGKGTTDAGLRLLGWLRERLASGGVEALDDIERAPANADTQAMVRVQITKLLEHEPGLAGELGRLVWGVQNESEKWVLQSNVQVGDRNRAVM
jgi:hypothetical protein